MSVIPASDTAMARKIQIATDAAFTKIVYLFIYLFAQ
jgi:hypothetical protein